MGNPKQKWTSEEEEALRAGVAKHGAGKWKNIQKDPEFHSCLYSRSNIDLKDKWRNLSVASGQGLRDKSKVPKAKANPADATASSVPASQIPTTVGAPPSDDVVALEAPRPVSEGINGPKYNTVIIEALSTLNEPDGSEFSAIAAFIEQRQEVAANFKRMLSSKLRRLVQQNKVEKVQNNYRLKMQPTVTTRMPMPPREPQPKQVHFPQTISHTEDGIEDAAASAAQLIVELDNKSNLLREAIKESERIQSMADEQEVFIALGVEFVEQCAHGDIFISI